MAGTPRVRNVAAKQVVKDLEEAGIAVKPVLRQARLQPYQIAREDGWLPYLAHAALFESAAKALDDPFYGMHAARKVEPRDLGALAYVGLASRTLGEALSNFERYSRIHTEAWSLNVAQEGKVTALELTPAKAEFYDYRQATEVLIAGFIHVYQSLLGEPLAPQAIHFVHGLERETDSATYRELLGCPVEFNHNRCQIVLARQQLSLPITTADDRLLRILKTHCDMVLSRHNPPSTGLTSRIEREIVDHLAHGKARAETIAGRLGMAGRTLHRRLAEEGTSFTALNEILRRELAHKYIRDATIPLQEIAFLLGYAGQSAFSVAFKRWTGKTPKQARSEAG